MIVWVTRKYHAILCKELEHSWILVSGGGSWNQSSLGTEGQLYKTSIGFNSVINKGE
jgi:hypothetical protein